MANCAFAVHIFEACHNARPHSQTIVSTRDEGVNTEALIANQCPKPHTWCRRGDGAFWWSRHTASRIAPPNMCCHTTKRAIATEHVQDGTVVEQVVLVFGLVYNMMH